ncbi:IPT/TIG domain-containing protein [Mucilaginibacter mallensis]|uniref:IPT/TIG domain-containing protein n=1 Tax=Mucilaginibacter mallensis TaxID=652787 RepID=A0A1H1ZRX1_MUCMA|nr:IPT/TIG domain-containing protein [Mucilaginibacter mallensis]SDT36444.1 IPT/TIG domain-containing protein [Mucilaginibacter mallensis]
MKSYLKKISYFLAMFCIIASYVSCNKPANITVYSYPAPLPSGMTPTSGYPLTNVTITGKSFGTYPNAVTVSFGGIKADTIRSCTDNQIVVQVPANAVSGRVTLKVWTHTVDSIGHFTVLTPPVVKSVSSNAGAPGDVITLKGTGFGSVVANLALSFNGTPGTVNTVLNDTLITATVPNNFTSGKLILSVGGYPVQAGTFTYLTYVAAPVYQLDFEGNLNATIGGSAATYIQGKGSPYTFIKGIDGQAISLAGYLVADGGTHQAIVLPTNAGQYNELSVSCWVYHPGNLSSTYFEPIFDFGTSNNALKNNQIALLAAAASWWNSAGENAVARYIYDINGTYQETNSITSQSIPQTGWHHMVLTASKTNHQMITYMDGAVIGTIALPANYDLTLATMDHTFIGSHSDYSNNWDYAGGVDKFQIYNYVLSANQVYTLYYKK